MKEYLADQIARILPALGEIPPDFDIQFQPPAKPEYGDLATNVALQLARPLKRSPRQIGEAIRDALVALPIDPDRISAIEVAGPGFLNFRFSSLHLYQGLADLLEHPDSYGKTEGGKGKRAMVEFVSANPTGPLTVGHGRNAVLGDTIANLLQWTGYEVHREYYYNDAGRQMRVLSQSIRSRYLQALDPDHPTKTLDDGTIVPGSFPEGGYQGAYIQEIAEDLVREHGDQLRDDESLDVFKAAGEKAIFAEIEQSLLLLGVKMDGFFNERSLYEDGRITSTLTALREKGLVYDQDGAVWFKTSELGKDRDVVLVKSSGEPTYRLPDIAYHVDKLDRGFDLLIDVFGADHIDTYPDVLSAVDVLGLDSEKIDVCIYQFVTLVRDGMPVKMSTRKANFVTLDDLVEEVTPDVTRFFFNMLSPNTHMNFDLGLAKEASEKNPCFYLQYAHARIASIIRKAVEVGYDFDKKVDYTCLTHDSAIDLIKILLKFPAEIAHSAEMRQPHRLIHFLRDVASAFTQFYHHCRIIGEEKALATARMALAKAAQIVLRNGLLVLGLSAPDKMYRDSDTEDRDPS